MCDLKAALKNMQRILIRRLIFYEFELGQNVAEASKNIYFAKGEDAADHSTITKWFKKFHSNYWNFDDQARSGMPKTMNSVAVLQATGLC